MILKILRRIKKHGYDVLFRGKKENSFPRGICHEGKYYYNQMIHLDEERGCAITCLAMLFSNYYGKFIPPARVFWWNLNQVYTYWNIVFFRAGLQWEEINIAGKAKAGKQMVIKEALKTHAEGVIAHFYNKNDDYRHYIVINKDENGLLGVADPMACGPDPEQRKGIICQHEDIYFEQSYTYSKFGGENSWDYLERIIMIRHKGNHGI